MPERTKEPRSRVAAARRSRAEKPGHGTVDAEPQVRPEGGRPPRKRVRTSEEPSGGIGHGGDTGDGGQGGPAPTSGSAADEGGEDAAMRPAAQAEGVVRERAQGGATSLPPAPEAELELSISPRVLKEGLAAVVSAIPVKATLPVLTHVLIAADVDGGVRITGTDLDTTVTRTVAAEVTRPGAVLVAGRKLAEIAREIPDACTLDLRVDGNTLHLRCGETRTRYRLATIPVEQFPTPPAMAWKAGFTVSAAALALLVARTSFAASTEETRPILNGVLWELGTESMTMAATNGHRLAVTRVPVATTADAAQVIVHPRALALVARLPQDAEDVLVSMSETYAGFRGRGWEILTRTIQGPYPDYRSVFPAECERTLVAERGSLMGALRRMAVVASDQTHRVRLVLGGEMMEIAVETPDVGTAHEDVPVEYEGDPLEIGFNAHYLLEILRYLPEGDVRIRFTGAERPIVLHPHDEEAGIRTEMLVMPLRLLS
jgi:DNA polymerase III subunit beta